MSTDDEVEFSGFARIDGLDDDVELSFMQFGEGVLHVFACFEGE